MIRLQEEEGRQPSRADSTDSRDATVSVAVYTAGRGAAGVPPSSGKPTVRTIIGRAVARGRGLLRRLSMPGSACMGGLTGMVREDSSSSDYCCFS